LTGEVDIHQFNQLAELHPEGDNQPAHPEHLLPAAVADGVDSANQIILDDDANIEGSIGWRNMAENARVLDVDSSTATVSMNVPGCGVRPFLHSSAFGGSSNQSQVYTGAVRDVVGAAMNGYNACILCYGQTGSGKTFTSFGPEGVLDAKIVDGDNLPRDVGVVIRACADLLHAKEQLAACGITVSLSAQFVEVYDEQVRPI
jgi:hypothetical protein